MPSYPPPYEPVQLGSHCCVYNLPLTLFFVLTFVLAQPQLGLRQGIPGWNLEEGLLGPHL